MIRILPTDKGDLEACENLVLASDELLIPHIKELLSWLQDMNWPVARRISQRLSSLGMELVPELREAFNSDDDVWKYWLVSDFLPHVNDEVYDALFFNLKRIEKHPSKSEVKEGVHKETEKLNKIRQKNKHIINSNSENSTIVNFNKEISAATFFNEATLSDPSNESLTKPPKSSNRFLKKVSSPILDKKIFIIDGNQFSTLEEFYISIETIFSPKIDWEANLDGFHEILHHCFDVYPEGVVIRWENSEASRKQLGYSETIKQLEKRLKKCPPTKKKIVLNAINQAKKEEGLTVFDWLIQIIKYYLPNSLGSSNETSLKNNIESKKRIELILL